MNQNQKNSLISHFNPVRIIVGKYRGGDKKFLAGNAEVLKKLLHISK